MNIELAIIQLADCIKDLTCMVGSNGDVELGMRLTEVYNRASNIGEEYYEEVKEILPTKEIPTLLNFVGLWRLQNGAYAKILSFDDDAKIWDAHLYTPEGKYAGVIFYDMYGNEKEGNEHLQLINRRIGEEKGYPNV